MQAQFDYRFSLQRWSFSAKKSFATFKILVTFDSNPSISEHVDQQVGNYMLKLCIKQQNKTGKLNF